MIYASAPGKINLFFEVGPLRPDGFHSVTSIYQSLAIRQRVGVTPAETWVVTTTGDLPPEQLDAGSQWGDIKSIQIKKFNFKESTGLATHTQIGVIAQELEQVCPNLVKTVLPADNTDDEDGAYKTVKLSVLYMKAVKALQEAMERIETLEAKVAALEAN